MTGQQRGEETRTNILEAALECFAQHGYGATGVAEICKRAGVTKGAFYYHFPSKQAVFLELFNRWLEGIGDQLAEARSEATSVPEGLLRMAGKAQSVLTLPADSSPCFSSSGQRPSTTRHSESDPRTLSSLSDYFSEIIQAGIEDTR